MAVHIIIKAFFTACLQTAVSGTSSAGGENICAEPSMMPQLQRDTNLMVPYLFSEKLPSMSLLRCVRICMNWKLCKSIDFDYEASNCYLNKYNSSDSHFVRLQNKKNYVHSSIDLWPIALAGSCRNHDCPERGYCEVKEDGDTRCVPL